MKENSIEGIIDIIKEKYTRYLNCETDIIGLTIEEAIFIFETYERRNYVTSIVQEACKVILSDYKRVLKENEQLKKENKELKNFRKNFVDVTDKELKEANDYFSRKYTFMGDELAQHINTLLKVTSNSIPAQKVKDILNEINKEYIKQEEIFNKYFEKENRDMQDYYIQKETANIMQELSWGEGKIQELLEGRK